MPYRFERMTVPRAVDIAEQWRYPEPFDFYNADADPEDLEELLDPAQWPDVFEACYEDDDFVGFFSASIDGESADVGLGMRPDLTGKGSGRSFVDAVISRLLHLHPELDMVTLMVAAFNERAIRTYRSCGFDVVGEHMQETNGSTFLFVDMSLRVSGRSRV